MYYVVILCGRQANFNVHMYLDNKDSVFCICKLGKSHMCSTLFQAELCVQILSMIEEAAGTRLYETKREAAQKTIEKKDTKLREIDTVSFCSVIFIFSLLLFFFYGASMVKGHSECITFNDILAHVFICDVLILGWSCVVDGRDIKIWEVINGDVP